MDQRFYIHTPVDELPSCAKTLQNAERLCKHLNPHEARIVMELFRLGGDIQRLMQKYSFDDRSEEAAQWLLMIESLSARIEERLLDVSRAASKNGHPPEEERPSEIPEV